MSADIPDGEAIDSEPMILAIVATEAVLRNPVAVVTAALLPGAVLRLPAMCTSTLPSDLLLTYLSGAATLCRPVVPLLPLLLLLILPRSGLLLLLLSCRVILLLTLLALLILLPSGLLLLLFRSIILLLTLLTLLILLPFGLLLFRSVVRLLTLLPLLILLPLGLLPFRLGLLLLFRRLSLFFLFVRFVLPRVSRSGDSEQQKKRGRTDNSNRFHVLPPCRRFLSSSLLI